MKTVLTALARANKALGLSQSDFTLACIMYSNGSLQVARYTDTLDRPLDKYTPISGIAPPQTIALWLSAFTVGVSRPA